MATVFVSIGSNINRYQHISSALDALQAYFGELMVSRVFESVAVGFEGDNFLNLAVGFECHLALGALLTQLRIIEDNNGRQRNGPKFSSRTMDIDILTYDELVGDIDGVMLPRDELSKNAFVLLPMVDIAPDILHPQLRESYRKLWSAYDKRSQRLWPVDFIWNEQLISRAD